MKRVVVILFYVLIASTALAQNTSGPVLTWENTSHDFGDLQAGDKVEHTFKFTNTGTEPLLITNVQVTCGCTTPKGWPRDPVQPGDKGELTVAFNTTGKFGKQNKVVTIVSNATNSEGAQITFSANVVEKKQPQ